MGALRDFEPACTRGERSCDRSRHRAAERGDELPLTKTIDPHVLPGSRNSSASYQTGKSWSGGVIYFEMRQEDHGISGNGIGRVKTPYGSATGYGTCLRRLQRTSTNNWFRAKIMIYAHNA
jgi:hypothetical protein